MLGINVPVNKHRESKIGYSTPILVPVSKNRELNEKIGYSPPILGTNVPVNKHRESKIGYSTPILESQPIPKTKVKNEISREQETTFPREIAVILVTCLQELSRKNGPTEVSLMKNDDTDRAKSGSLLQRLTSRNLVVTALIANSRAKKQNYSNAENQNQKSGVRPYYP